MIELGEMRRISRNRYNSRVQAAEKPFDEVQPGRVEQQCTLTFRACLLKPRGNCVSTSLQFSVRQMKLGCFAVEQEGIG